MQTVQNYQRRFIDLMEKELGVTQARTQFKTIIDQVQHQGDTYIINRHGKAAAAIVPVEVYENWKRERDAFFASIRTAQKQANLSPEEADAVTDEAIAHIRTGP